MASYNKTRDILGFKYTEPGSDAVANYCNGQQDRFDNISLFFLYLVGIITILALVWVGLK